MSTWKSKRRWVGLAAAITVALGAAGAVGWALSAVLKPADDPLSSDAVAYAVVTQGEVGATLNLNATASWPAQQAGTNQSSGIVTSVNVSPVEEVVAGTVIYTVDLRPVVIAQGDIPAFRAVSRGVVGADVSQLQELLASLDVYEGIIDGKAEAGTEAAIKAWQKTLGVEQTGVVETADVLYVPTLPSRVVLNGEAINRGASLSGGENAVASLPSSPTFSITATAAQAAQMPAGTEVTIETPAGGEPWRTIAAEQAAVPDSDTVKVALISKEGESICGDACTQIPAVGQTTLSAQIETVAPVAGLVVPTAAIRTTASGDSVVVDSGGSERPVKVIASARGMSAIEGVPEGTQVEVSANRGSPGGT